MSQNVRNKKTAKNARYERAVRRQLALIKSDLLITARGGARFPAPIDGFLCKGTTLDDFFKTFGKTSA